MKVVEKKPFWTLTCRGCRSKLEVDISDVLLGIFGGSYCENGDEEYYISCPVCGMVNFLPESKVTVLVINKFRRKKKSESA